MYTYTHTLSLSFSLNAQNQPNTPENLFILTFIESPSVAGYVHRIGRCGRAGRGGVAVTFLVDSDRRLASELVDLLRRSSQHVPVELSDWARGGGTEQDEPPRDDDSLAEAEARAENRRRQLAREQIKREKGRGRRKQGK